MSLSKSYIDTYGKKYLIIDFNNLFISSTIREEIYLLSFEEKRAVIKLFNNEMQSIDISPIDIDRDLTNFSGGERAIISIILILCIIIVRQLNNVRILLIDILPSLSKSKKKMIQNAYRRYTGMYNINLFINDETGIINYYLNND